MSSWTDKDVRSVESALGASLAEGLASSHVASLLEKHGPNELRETGRRHPLIILLAQLKSLMVLLLIGAAVVSGVLLHEWEDAAVIGVVVILNALLGFQQEFKAERAMAALKKLAAPKVRVRRDSRVQEVGARELVPGDIVLLEAGNLVPADCRLAEAPNLRVRESALTGEAEAVSKTADLIEGESLPLGDRRNMAYMGTIVTYGRGTGIVTDTGMRTELGNIASMLQGTVKEDTVLQKKLNGLSHVLVGVAVALIAAVSLVGWLARGQGPREVFMTAVSMAVAAIPEGLPAVVTISLALGAQRMLRRRALIRRLPAVETLGSVTVICSDKTGTLTLNRMTATEIRVIGRETHVPATAHLRTANLKRAVEEDGRIASVLAGGTLCSDAVIEQAGDGFSVVGDPTEGALVAAGAWAEMDKAELEKIMPRTGELPFDSDRKRMTTVHGMPGADTPQVLKPLISWVREEGGNAIGFTKGAADSVLSVASRAWTDQGVVSLTDELRADIMGANDELSGDGVRVLALAVRALGDAATEGEALEEELVYLGLVGMLDPLRGEVRKAILTCRKAGIRPVMITGDHPLIARNIATQLGLDNPAEFRTGHDLAKMDRAALEDDVKDVSVYARVAPKHKLEIVDALQKRGHVVAMTGDGVNDAPALKEADIGVAMGITGTDVSREASDMVLQDDNFATIVSAVEEGRVIFDNIKRFVRFILASNLAEILVMLLSFFVGLPLPLIAVQILWMNLVTDGLPALALGVEPGEPDIMTRPPREPKAPIFTKAMGLHILWVGGLMAVMSLAVGRAMFDPAGAPAAAATGHGHGSMVASTWQTMLFTVLVFSQLTLALAERSRSQSLLSIGLFSNPHMVGAVALTFGLQLAVIYIPLLQRFFKTTALTLAQLGIVAGASLVVLVAVEIGKMTTRAGASGPSPSLGD